IFSSILPRPLTSTLFPYTTLFRSGSVRLDVEGAGWSIRYTPTATNNNTVFGLLLEASAKFGFTVAYITYQIPQGVFVTAINGSRSEEHTSELQSRSDLVCRLLLEK